jgi:O-antigen/teichoic acid export membrane protein
MYTVRNYTTRAIRKWTSSDVARQLLTTVAWSAIGDAISKGLMLVSMVVVARILGKHGYGEFGLIRTTINLFATVGGAGLGFTANRYVARFRTSDRHFGGQIIGTTFLIGAVVGALVAVGVFASADYISSNLMNAPGLAGSLRLAAFVLFFSAITGAQAGILQGLAAYRSLALASFIQGVTGLIAFVAGAILHGVQGVLVGFLVSALAGVVAFQAAIWIELKAAGISPSYRSLSSVLPVFWSFSVPAALMGIAVAPFKWIAETMLARTAGFQSLGIFSASMTAAMLLFAVVSTLNAPLISATANASAGARGGRLEYLNLYGSWFLFLFLAAPLVLFPDLPSLLFGSDFSGNGLRTATLLLTFYCGLMTYYQGIMRLVALNGSMWFGLVTNLCEGLALLAAFFALRGNGLIGLALAYVISYAVRIAVTSPILLRKGIVSPALMFDRAFLVSMLALASLISFQIYQTT